jgi:hypothetical protein
MKIKRQTKTKGFKLTQDTIDMIDVLADDYRGNQSMLIQKLVENEFNTKITRDETSSK